ncbi:uncharacterized protein [Musca autumnalis]|uniref:uncharacterized protein n=1 Tax=Musca autumnalis TaxID=221902 RepID=UPI003CECBAAB
MATVQELIALQEVRGSNFDKFVATIKKAPLERRTEEFYVGKRNELVGLWQTFEKAENQIRNDPSLPEDDPYIAENLHKNIGEKFSSTIDYIEAELDKLKSAKSRPGPTEKAQKTSSEVQTSVQVEEPASAQVEGLARRIKARMAALMRHLQSLDNIETGQSNQFYGIKEETIKKLWSQITDLYEEIWQQIEDPSRIGLDQDSYDSLEDTVQHNLIRLAVLKDKCSDNATNAPLLGTTPQRPKNVVSQNEFVSHLALTEENYKTAWMLLQDRYNNKRILVSTLVEKIINQPTGISSTASIKALHDTTRECMLALKNLDIDTSSWDALLIQLITKKLDQTLYIRFMQSLTKPKEVPTMNELFAFLELQFESMESIGKVATTQKGSSKTVSSIASVEDNSKCSLCKNGHHPIYRCKQFLAMRESERLKWVQQHKMCTNCFKYKHNTLLHLPSKSKTSSIASNQSPTTRNDAAPVNTAAISSASVEDQKNVILATAKVIIKAANGMSGEFRAVLDSGSQAFVLPTIIPAQPNHDLDITKWQIPQNIKLADPNFNTQGKVDILLGAEFYFSLMQPGTIKLSGNQPILQNTALGWIVGGLIEQTSTDVTPAALTCAIFDSETSLEQAIEKLWKLEEVEASEEVMSPLEKLCESHYNQHVQTDEYGRFIVRLPFRESPTALGKSHAMAYNRFMSLERRLLQKEDIRSQYIKFMQEYEQLGHMQTIDVGTVSNKKYFIPHHCVLKPDSTTTKLRVVFDASAKTSSSCSLNDLMYTGPTVQSELFSILLRFRLPKFVFTTDIEKMYKQILLHPDDQKYQLIIWREDTTHPVSYYKLNTVTYDTRTAPYLATKCLQKIADDNMDRYPLGSKMLKENFYMDDGLSGADSLSTALETQKELIAILKQHGFNLRKWSSNFLRLLKDIPHSDREVNLDLDENINKTIKTFGVILDASSRPILREDKYRPSSISKRSVTSELAKLFDPLGLLAPVVVKSKIFIQQLWQFTLDWDEPLPNQTLCYLENISM